MKGWRNGVVEELRGGGMEKWRGGGWNGGEVEGWSDVSIVLVVSHGTVAHLHQLSGDQNNQPLRNYLN